MLRRAGHGLADSGRRLRLHRLRVRTAARLPVSLGDGGPDRAGRHGALRPHRLGLPPAHARPRV